MGAPASSRTVTLFGVRRRDEPSRHRSRRPLGATTRTRLAYLALRTMLALGVIGGLLSIGRLGQSGGGHLSPAPPVPSPIAPAGWAALYVRAYLGAGQNSTDTLRPFLSDVPTLADVPSGSWRATSAVPIDAHMVAASYWSVTVAAEVEGEAADGWEPLGTRFYTVAVQVHDDGFVATSPPTEVAGPPKPAKTRTVFATPAPPVAGDPLADAVGHFVAALLAGQGEISRYLTPGTAIRAIQPAPFAKVTVTGLSTTPLPGPRGGAPRTRVLAELEGADTAGRVQVLSYVLDLSELLGQWEVTAMPAVPPLRT